MPEALKVTGLQESMTQLAGMVRAVRNKYLRKAMNAAGTIVLKVMRRLAPVEVGRDELSRNRSKVLKKSLGRKVKAYAKKGVMIVIVGPRRGFRKQVGVRKRGKNVGQPVYYDPAKTAHLVEKGTSHSAAKPFARPAGDTTKAQVEAAVVKIIDDGIKAESAKKR